MKYGLERMIQSSAQDQARFVLCGVCGKRGLLERIRAGQEYPDKWRVTVIGDKKSEQLLEVTL